MTYDEITAYVMALSVEDVRRLTATDVMGWTLRDLYESTTNTVQLNRPLFAWMDADGKAGCLESTWRPDIDRNQSRQVVLKVADAYGPDCIVDAMYDVTKDHFYAIATADQESRAALIAHMIHKEESYGDTA